MTLCDIGNTTAKFYKDGVVRYIRSLKATNQASEFIL